MPNTATISPKPKVTMTMPSATRARVLSAEAEAQLRSFADVTVPDDDDLTTENLPHLLDGAAAALTGWKSPPFPDAFFDSERTLRFVAHSAGSIRFLKIAEAIEAGTLCVSHSAPMIADPVAEFTITQALVHLRRPVPLDRGMRDRKPWLPLRDRHMGEMLCDQIVGIVGAGYVGQLVIRLLHAFGARILVFDPYMSKERAEELDVDLMSLDDLFSQSDIVSLHAPVITETYHMITDEHLSRLRDGALLINTARAAIIDETILLDHLRSGRIFAALDVFETEPLPDDSPLRDLPNTYLTPHSSGHSKGSYLRQGQNAVDEIRRFLDGEPLKHEVTKAKLALMA